MSHVQADVRCLGLFCL